MTFMSLKEEQISKGVGLLLEVLKPPKSPKKREKEPGPGEGF